MFTLITAVTMGYIIIEQFIHEIIAANTAFQF